MDKMLQIGDLIDGRYEVDDLVNQGGQALLAKAVDQQTGLDVAVKQLTVAQNAKNYDEEVKRFERSGRTRIGHRRVVDPTDFIEDIPEYYLIMPWIPGGDLQAILDASGGKLPADQAVTIAVGIAEGLQGIHLQGLVHRDIKPANILMHPQEGPLITDLGICHNINEQTITNGHSVLGSLFY